MLLFGLTMLYMAEVSRQEAYIRVLSLQGLLLFLLVIFHESRLETLDWAFLIVETLIFKSILIPWLLRNVVRKAGIAREVEPYVSYHGSLFIVSILLFGGLLASFWAAQLAQNIKPLYFGMALSTVATGLFIILTRKKIITHIMGFMVLENGIFLMTLAIAKEMPLLINLGVLLDVFVGVFLLVAFFYRIQSTFAEVHIDDLNLLRD